MYVVGPEDDEEDIKEEAMQDIRNVMSRIDKSGEGVCVQASTLGSLEALLEFLKSPAVKIPVSGISIGPVHKKDVMRASVMLERKRKEFATILAFDVKVWFSFQNLILSKWHVRIVTYGICPADHAISSEGCLKPQSWGHRQCALAFLESIEF